MDNRWRGRNLKQSFDWKLVLIYLLLVFIGWVNIYASVHSSEPSTIFDWSVRSGKQFIWILTAFGLAGLILFAIPPRMWESGSAFIYALALGLLIAVIFLGVEVKGSRSWFEFGPVRFQPAEVSKISTSLMLAFVMSRQNFKMNSIKGLLTVGLVIGIPMVVILGESETGSALVYLGFIFMLYREGLSGWLLALIGMVILVFILTLVASPYVSITVLAWLVSICCASNSDKIGKWLFIDLPILILLSLLPWIFKVTIDAPMGPQVGVMGVLFKLQPLWFLLGAIGIAIPVMVFTSIKGRDFFKTLGIGALVLGIVTIFSTSFVFDNVLQDHQRKRIEVLLGMKEDPSGVGYNVNQSMIAIGSGGLIGKGFLHGTQTSYGFVPEQSTDFIFCTVGEEWGFVGCTIVILLYVLMIWRIIHDAERSRERFTRIYGYCVACCLFMHLFINIGMTIGLMPVIGIPLPLMSYGGSSLWAFTVLISIFVVLDHGERKYF